MKAKLKKRNNQDAQEETRFRAADYLGTCLPAGALIFFPQN